MRSHDLRALFRHVLSVSLIAPAAAAGAAACSGATLEPGTSTDGGAGTDGASSDAARDGSGGECLPPNSPRWTKPGCGRPADACFTPDTPEPACFTAVCGCSGKVIGGCMSFTEPYTTMNFDPMNMPTVGAPCDPTGGDAGLDASVDASRDVNVPDGCVTVPEPVADAGAACTPWDVPLPCSFDDASAVNAALCQPYCGPNANFCSKDATQPILHCDPAAPSAVVGGLRDERVGANRERRYDHGRLLRRHDGARSRERVLLRATGERARGPRRARGLVRQAARRPTTSVVARVAGALASRFGADPTPPKAARRRSVRSRPSRARERGRGLRAGDVRALSATLQAEQARDEKVRAALRRIAVDETSHARLAWDVAEWIATRLDQDARARVTAASRSAVAELRVEVGREQPAIVREIAGLPDADVATRMVDAMSVTLWAA
ncbi:MAG: hypothetical protein U0235_05390 [Polyangiaceae bacterium]